MNSIVVLSQGSGNLFALAFLLLSSVIWCFQGVQAVEKCTSKNGLQM